MIKTNETLKGLKSQLAKAIGEYESLKTQVNNLQNSSTNKKKQINSLKSKISLLEKPIELEVSEHALLRYFERVLKFDLDKIKEELLDEQVKSLVNQLGGSGTFPNKNNIRLVIKDKMVTTILD